VEATKFIADDTSLRPVGLCPRCAHKFKDRVGCLAFPDAIPRGFITGAADHRSPIAGQVGTFVFTEASDAISE